MSNSPLNKRIALINIGVVILLIADTYVLSPRMEGEFFDESSHNYVPGARTNATGHSNFYIHSTTGHTFKVPEEIYLELNSIRDSFYIYETGLFRKPLRIRYRFESETNAADIGMVNSGRACQIFLIYAALISVLNLFPFLIVRPTNLNQNLLFIGFFLAMGTLIIYFWWA